MPNPLRVALLAILAMLPFVIFPRLDLAVSDLFFAKGWMDSPASEGIRFALWRLSGVVLLAAFVLWLLALVRKRAILRGPARLWGLIVLTYALGPGLLVDTLLKRHWGRARPADVAEFGGSLTYSPPWWPSDQCLSNCSFVSGEVSGATATAIALLLVLGLWRDRLSPLALRVLAVLAAALPLVTALQRLSTGRHFLSDTLFAMLFTLLLASLLHRALIRRKPLGN
ncbi:phosphatase PAP2 family protein [Paragemmobacter straminiformis]|uniref:Phosphatase PAP2 family protein n=1 Tax=Paragemmobacter straminiformis TaxID=2045119 RepID=A0A842IDG0_9RHOB|nr:phosphatase PAP2 family protein [Gemmobacter straminiformis]MBC2836948.1 phosphatase PAP2 family protein [Gemmobacter straminiformis]